MKKIISISALFLILLSFSAFSQSNLTWTLKGDIEKVVFEKQTVFITNLSGFDNKEQSSKFIEKLKSNPEVSSVELTNADVLGNSDLKLIMKQPHDRFYYLGMAQKMGISLIQLNGVKKTPEKIIAELRKEASNNK